MNKFNFRDAVFEEVEKIFIKNKKTVLLTNDMGAMGLDKLKKKFNKRVINCGICEQHIMSMAGGLSAEGYHVFIYGIISHLIFRGFEQLKIDICVDILHVTILGIGAGLSYGNDGPTHHAIEDTNLLQSIPNTNIFNPTDIYSLRRSIKLSEKRQFSLIRLDKENVFSKNEGVERLDPLLNFYKKEKSKTLLLTTGITTNTALEIQNKLMKIQNVDVLDVVWRHPLNMSILGKILINYKNIFIIDENMKSSSLESEIFKICYFFKKKPSIKSFNLGDKFLLGSATRKWAWKKFKLNSKDIIKILLK